MLWPYVQKARNEGKKAYVGAKAYLDGKEIVPEKMDSLLPDSCSLKAISRMTVVKISTFICDLVCNCYMALCLYFRI